MNAKIVFFLGLFLLRCFTYLVACEEKEIVYPAPQNSVDWEIDSLLTEAEKQLVVGEFRTSLDYSERADGLLHLTQDQENHRELRILLDQALAATCLEGPTENNLIRFKKFQSLLKTKSCSKNQNLIIPIGKNWPFYGSDEPMTPSECLATVKNTMKKVELAAIALLPTGKITQFALQSILYALEKGAEQCCQERGFWKTCMQPLVNAWQDMEILKIPPDPAWD